MVDSTDSRVQLVCQLQCSELFSDSLQIPTVHLVFACMVRMGSCVLSSHYG